MKVTGKPDLPATFSGKNPSDADLKHTTWRRTRNPSLTRVKRVGAQVGRRSRPETPLLKWKVEDREREKDRTGGVDDEDEGGGWRRSSSGRRKGATTVSARKLAAGLWRLQLPERVAVGGGERRGDRLGFQVISLWGFGFWFFVV
ncbi:hypothetical protein SLEP1_g46694 [Rubroshorea leprosula]|uniref:Uncharacterized protein n=1 Tax=Rubroshorea leprosula TaxID=152421 RepID=A0AAV5LPQ8_9ROSI|nr:hypothetical protein SLEP1_g46694 [Rubroshorea leprosula]